MEQVIKIKNISERHYEGRADGKEYRWAPGEAQVVPFEIGQHLIRQANTRNQAQVWDKLRHGETVQREIILEQVGEALDIQKLMGLLTKSLAGQLIDNPMAGLKIDLNTPIAPPLGVYAAGPGQIGETTARAEPGGRIALIEE